jgi:phosphate:Na+ symporter
MTTMIFELLGGVGLFLLGMTLLTDGLRAFAGSALRDALVRFTGTPAKAFSSGVLVTLAVQSSSATTVTLIGFVSAGLITFPQAIGVVMGASLGTTGTGWLVSVLGLKVDLGSQALPLVGIGALTHLLARGRWRPPGLAIAGFGLIFIGIGTLQDGMQSIAGRFDPAWLPVGTFAGQLAALGIGIVMTVLMQSSSAAVATTLTALHAQAVTFEQAAPLVIGAAIGTTVTGALAAIGGTVPARRTALAHVAFNLATGLIALLLLPVLLWLIALAQRHLGLQPGAVSLAAFHTTFIAIGVAVFLPFTDRFARAIERLLPERGPHLTRHLDDSLLSAPPVALEAVHRALTSAALELVDQAQALMRTDEAMPDAARIAETRAALDRIERFLARIPPTHGSEPLSALHVAQLHALDHLKRFADRLDRATRPGTAARQAALRQPARAFGELLALARRALAGEAPSGWPSATASLATSIATLHEEARAEILRQTAAGGAPDPLAAMATLDALRWTERTAHHVWRICHHLVDDARDPRAPVEAPGGSVARDESPGQ